ncbi:MAG: HRDC domain-containing protein, partial [Acidimicrobiales bacterium]
TTATPDWAGVRLSTIHRVKGREWPHVIVHDATGGLIPHRLASDVEEERRVFHVAITRSSEQTLVVSGTPASPFVAELTEPPDPNTPAPAVSVPTRRTGTPATASRSVPEATSIEEAQIRERLRTWRNDTAKAAGVPAYVVFNDATLYAIAERRPLDHDELLDISGIGPVKVERYADAVLEIITDVLGG